MSDYRGMIADCDEQDKKIFERGIVRKTRTYWTTPDGKEYDGLAEAIEKAPIITNTHVSMWDNPRNHHDT